VRAADLDDLAERLLLAHQLLVQKRERWQQPVHDLLDRGDVHRSRERVVRRLAHVDVIVRMHRRLAAELAAEQLDRAVRDHLIEVHVRLRARTGLPDDKREVAVELAVDHFARGAGDGGGPAAVEQAELPVGLG
jgi:hypothetical protein